MEARFDAAVNVVRSMPKKGIQNSMRDEKEKRELALPFDWFFP